MFNLLVSGDLTAWASGQRMGMMRNRFGEYSGDEIGNISVDIPESLKILERVQTLLMYEYGLDEQESEIVRVGQMKDIRVGPANVTFRFAESGQLKQEIIYTSRTRLQMHDFELSRTHWAIKDGDIPQDIQSQIVSTPKTYDIVLSFAGEDRSYVERVAEFLDKHAVAVFYDEYERATLWGKDLPEHFDSIYRKHGRFCVMFISKHYADKVWTKHEKRSALARALEERVEYILPARFDDTEIPGLRSTIGYVDLRDLTAEALGQLILQKLGRNSPS